MNGIALVEYWHMELTFYLFYGGIILVNLIYIYYWLKAYRRLIYKKKPR